MRLPEEATLLCKGLPAGPGAASGAFSSMPKKPWKSQEGTGSAYPVETSPKTCVDDCRPGHLDSRGGVSSHAAWLPVKWVSLRLRAADLEVNYKSRTVKVAGKTFKEGDYFPSTERAVSFRRQLKTARRKSFKFLSKRNWIPKEPGLPKLFQAHGLVRKGHQDDRSHQCGFAFSSG